MNDKIKLHVVITIDAEDLIDEVGIRKAAMLVAHRLPLSQMRNVAEDHMHEVSNVHGSEIPIGVTDVELSHVTVGPATYPAESL